jgi:molecular chaperone GrpE
MFADEKNPTHEPPGSDTSAGTMTPEAEIEALRAEAKEWRDKYLRQLADFDNYRKRMRQESDATREAVAESLIVSLLPVMDDFDRMLAGAESNDPMRKGVELIRDKLRAFLEMHGVAMMDARGKPFDPSQHDAIVLKPTGDFPTGIVLDVLRPGYRMKDKVIRHAQVIVSAEPEVESPAQE